MPRRQTSRRYRGSHPSPTEVGERVFHRFRPKRTGAFVSWDRERRELTWIPNGGDGSEVSEWVQHDREVPWGSFRPGDPVRIQDGEVTGHSSTMRGGLRQFRVGRGVGVGRQFNAYTGYECIDHVGFNHPTVSLLCLRTMEAVLGADETARHLREWADGASTRQTSADMRLRGHKGMQEMHFSMEGGRMRCSWRLSNHVLIEYDALHFPGEGLPDSVLNALAGRPLSDICAHPCVADPLLVVDRVVTTGFGNTIAHVDPAVTAIPVDEAVAMLRPALAEAA